MENQIMLYALLLSMIVGISALSYIVYMDMPVMQKLDLSRDEHDYLHRNGYFHSLEFMKHFHYMRPKMSEDILFRGVTIYMLISRSDIKEINNSFKYYEAIRRMQP